MEDSTTENTTHSKDRRSNRSMERSKLSQSDDEADIFDDNEHLLNIILHGSKAHIEEFLQKNGLELNNLDLNEDLHVSIENGRLSIVYQAEDTNLNDKEIISSDSLNEQIKNSLKNDELMVSTKPVQKLSETVPSERKPLDNADSEEVERNQEIDLKWCFVDRYSASGLKFTLHGNIYQLKMLMLYVARACKNRYPFCLATEMDAADKFDDIVFEYKKLEINSKSNGSNACINPENSSKSFLRCVQVKHKIDHDNKMITSNALNSSKNDFYLQKYFISCCKITQNVQFKNAELEEFTIITNIDFDHKEKIKEKSHGKFHELNTWKKLFEKESEVNDPFLNIENQIGPNKYKFKDLSDKNSTVKDLKAKFEFDMIKNALESMYLMKINETLNEAKKAKVDKNESAKKLKEEKIKVKKDKVIPDDLNKSIEEVNDDIRGANPNATTNTKPDSNICLNENEKKAIIEKLEAMKISHFKDLIGKTVDAAKVMKTEIEIGNRRKGLVLDYAETIKNLVDEVFFNDEIAKQFKEARNKLDADSVKRKVGDLGKAIENVETKINELPINIRRKLSLKKKRSYVEKARHLLETTRQLLDDIDEKDEYKDLEDAYANLDESLSTFKSVEESREKKLSEAFAKILDKAEILSQRAQAKLDNSKAILQKYGIMDSLEFKIFKSGKEKLSNAEIRLSNLKKKISNSSDLDEVVEGIEYEISNGVFPESVFDEYKNEKIDLNQFNEKLDEVISEISLICVALNDDTFDRCLDEFIKKFRIVTKFPNELELGGLIKKELGEFEQFKKFNGNISDLIYDSFQREMLVFFKDYEKGKAVFYTSKKADIFFRDLEHKLHLLDNSEILRLGKITI